METERERKEHSAAFMTLSNCFLYSKDLLNENIISYICMYNLELQSLDFSVRAWKELTITDLHSILNVSRKLIRYMLQKVSLLKSLTSVLNDQTSTPSIKITNFNNFHLISFLMILQ